MAESLFNYLNNKYLKILLIGDPGTGKTCTGLSLAAKYKTWIGDTDGKVTSAANFYSDKPELLNNVTVENLQLNMTSDPIQTFISFVDTKLIPQQRAGKMEYDVLMVDSFTNFSNSALNHIVKTNPGIKRVSSKQGVSPGLQDYGILRRELKRLILGMLSLPCHVVMTAHVGVTKDELTGEILRHPVGDGSFASELGIYYDEVWLLSVDDKGRRIAQTQSDYKYKFCRTQMKGLPVKLDITDGLIPIMEKYL